jgi:hypothetical protein
MDELLEKNIKDSANKAGSKLVNDYFVEQIIRDVAKEEVRDRLNANATITESSLTAIVNDQIAKYTKKYVDDLVREEVYNMLKTGKLREIIKEMAPELIRSSVISHVTGAVDESMVNLEKAVDDYVLQTIKSKI